MVLKKYLLPLVGFLKKILLAFAIVLKNSKLLSPLFKIFKKNLMPLAASLKKILSPLVLLLKKILTPIAAALKKYSPSLFMILKKYSMPLVGFLKNRRWLLLIGLPAIISILLIFLFSTFEAITYQTREGETIEYKVPLSSNALIPAYVLWTSSILLIFAIVPTSYYFISRKLEEKLEKNMKIISKLISKNNKKSKKESMKLNNKDIIFRFLNLNERKVIKKLVEKKGTVLQSEINLMEGMTKLKTHRAVRDLERKSIIKTEAYGKTNRIILSKEIKDFITK